MKLTTSRTLFGLLLISSLSLSTLAAEPKVDSQTKEELLELRTEKAKLSAQERLLKLKTVLELREDQLSAWNDYENYMLNEQSGSHTMMKDLRQRRANNEAPPNSLELAQQNIQRLENQLANAQQRLIVFTDLYNTLDEEQQKKLDRATYRQIRKMAKPLKKRKPQRN